MHDQQFAWRFYAFRILNRKNFPQSRQACGICKGVRIQTRDSLSAESIKDTSESEAAQRQLLECSIWRILLPFG